MKVLCFIIAFALLVLGASLNKELTAIGCSTAPFAFTAFGFVIAGIASAVHDFNQKHNYK